MRKGESVAADSKSTGDEQLGRIVHFALSGSIPTFKEGKFYVHGRVQSYN